MSKIKTALCAAALAVAFCTPGFAMDRLDNADLDRMRAGYLSAGGFNFDFGAVVTTWIDGTLALQSKLSLSSAGAVSSVTPGDMANVPALPGSALSFNGTGGVTSLIQDLSQNSIRNLIINTANNRNIVQNTAIMISIPDLPLMQQGMSLEHLNSSLQEAMHSGLLSSSSH